MNQSRALRWHPAGLQSWSMSDWYAALSGEVGEVIEVVQPFGPVAPAKALADEVGDVFAYADLFAQAAQLDFHTCIQVYVERSAEVPEWHTAKQWALELAKQSGKLGDVVKKLNRVRDGLSGNQKSTGALWEDLVRHLGAIGYCLSHLAESAGLQLDECVRGKFNAVSERMGFPERI